MTALATHRATETLAVPFDMTVQLGQAEPLGAGVKRVTLGSLETAASGFFEGESQFRMAIHQARKSMKRVRGMLRLVRGELGDRIYRYENVHLRDTARLVSEVRTSAALVETAERVSGMYGDLLADGTFEGMAEHLAQRRDRLELRAMEDPELIGKVVRNIEKAYNRYSAWPTDEDAREVYGTGIRNSFAAVQPGMHRIYSRGRREMVVAYADPSSHNFHQWRKRAKYLRFQMEFLAPLWPDMVLAMATTLQRLESVLGEDHDLADLSDVINRLPQLCPNPRERSLYFALASQRQAELRAAAEVLGRMLYAETPVSLESRFAEYWNARSMVNSLSMPALELA